MTEKDIIKKVLGSFYREDRADYTPEDLWWVERVEETLKLANEQNNEKLIKLNAGHIEVSKKLEVEDQKLKQDILDSFREGKEQGKELARQRFRKLENWILEDEK